MGVKRVTGSKAVDAVIAQLSKRFSKETLITLGPSREDIKSIPTGSLGLDMAIGIGGIPVGRIIEIFGPESSGKTSLALNIAKEYEKIKASLDQPDRWVLVIDLEHSIPLSLVTGFGLDPDKIIFTKPETAEEAFQTMLDLVATGEIGLVIFDSVDAAQSEAQLKKNVGEATMGGISKIMSEVMRQFSKLCETTGTTTIFINQIRQNPGQMFGSPEVTPGGNALKFYSSIRMHTYKGKPSKDLPFAWDMRVKLVKNKVWYPTDEEISFTFCYAKGPDPNFDLISTAKSLGLIYAGGQSIKINWPETPEATDTLVATGGFKGLASLLEQDQELYKRLKEACFTKVKTPDMLTVEGAHEDAELDGTEDTEVES